MVTNLNNSGPGSLRAHWEATGKRYITFDDSLEGYITLTDRIEVTSGQFTLDGSAASVCVRGPAGVDRESVRFTNVNDAVINQMRIGIGDGTVPSVQRRSLQINGGSNIYLKNSEFYWSTDQIAGGQDLTNITSEDCIIAHGLSLADHYNSGFQRHSMGTLINSSDGLTYLRCIWLHNESRNPQIDTNGRVELLNCITAGCTFVGLQAVNAGSIAIDAIGNIYVQTTEVSPYITPNSQRLININDHYIAGLYIDDCYAVTKSGLPSSGQLWPPGSGGDAWGIVGHGGNSPAPLAARSLVRLAASPAQPPILPASALWQSLRPTVGKTLPWRLDYAARLLNDVEIMLARDGREPTYGIIDGVEGSIGGGTVFLGGYPSMANPG